MASAPLSKPGYWVLATLLFSLLARALFYRHLPPGAPLDAEHLAYFDALRHHLVEYLAYTPRKPPLFSLFHAPVAWLFGDEAIAAHRLITVELFVLDSVAAALFVATATTLGAWAPLAAVVVGGYSLCLMPLELMAINYDRPLLFCLGLFLFALARTVRSGGAGSLWAVALAGMLLIAQSTIASVLVPVTVVPVLAAAYGLRPIGPFVRRVAICLGLPALMLGALVAKNLAVAGIAASANGAGHTHILFVMNMMDWKVPAIRALAVEAKAPAWYLWCYDHPVKMDETPDMVYARSLGLCGVKLTPDLRDIDMTGLRDAMARLGDDRMVRVVEGDMRTLAEKPYLFAPFSLWASRWFAEFSTENLRIARYVFARDPERWLNNASNIHKVMWVREGPRSLGAYVTTLWPERGVEIYMQPVLARINRHLEHLTRSTYLAIPWIAAVLAVGALLPAWFRRRSVRRSAAWPGRWLALATAAGFDAMMASARRPTRSDFEDAVAARWRTGILSATAPRLGTLVAAAMTIVPILLMTAIFCGTVGTENERFFQQAIPHLCILAVVMATAAARVALKAAGLVSPPP